MKNIAFSSASYKDLFKQMQQGAFAVPKLQRAFVWSGAKAAKLLDSIYRQMPIGPVTLWDTVRKNKSLLRHTSNVIPPFDDSNPKISFVLDGQQRLSVLFKAAAGGKQQLARGKEIDFDRVVFRVTDGDAVPRFAYRHPVQNQWISFSAIFSSHWRTSPLGKGLTKGQKNRVETCRERLLAYKIPIIRVETQDLEEVRELFLRINSLGTPLATSDRAFARASAFDLRGTAEETIASLPKGFQSLTYEVLLQTRALIEGIKDVGEKSITAAVQDWNKRISTGQETVQSFTRAWDLQTKATTRALDFLRTRFKVIDSGVLPSQYMVATLSYFFYANPKQPNPHQITELKRWFWATALGQRYSGSGFRSNILGDVLLFDRLATGKNAAFKLENLIDPQDVMRAKYGRRSSIGDAICLLLILRKPCYLKNGEDIQLDGYASAANRKHLHHIFPRKHLDRQMVARSEANSMANICYVAADENSEFGSKAPTSYLKPYRDEHRFPSMMARHLIPADQESPLWEATLPKSYSAFLKMRTKMICAEFNLEVAGMKLFRDY